MEFNQKILEKLRNVFKKYDLNIVEQRINYLRLESQYVVIVVAHNHLEKSNMLLLGGNDRKLHMPEIDNKVLSSFFNSDLKLSQVPVEIFINNLFLFFENEAQPLLRGDKNMITKLEEFDSERSRKYTQDLIEKQNLNAASVAWKNTNYREFIRIMEQFDENKLLPSYKLKYKIAKQKII